MADKDFRVKRGIHVGTDAYISNSITSVNAISFNTDGYAGGNLYWNSSDGTLDIEIGYADVVLQVGQETHYVVRNATGSTILNGTALYCSGVTVGSGRIEASPMVGDGTISPVQFLGLATQDINSGVNGVVTYFGYVRNVDTRGTANTALSVGDEDWSVGDKLYVHPTAPGKLTKVEPEAPSTKICTAVVINRHETSGVLFVRPTTNLTLNDHSDVQSNAAADGDVLTWVTANSRWEPTTVSAGSSSLNVALANSSNIATNVVSGVSTLLFDTDSGLDIVNLGGGNVKVQLNSTFKTWEVDGQESLIAEGLDNVRFVAGDGISITTNALASPKSIEFAWNANTWVNANDYTTYTTLNSRINSVQSNVTSISADGIINSETFTTVSTSNTFSLYTTVGDANNIIVSLSGIVQYPTLDYVVAGSTLTLSNVAPITGGLVLEVRYLNTRGRGSDDAVLFSDSFAVDGSTNAFTLSGAVSNKTSLLVYFDGLLQHDDTYETSGNTLTIANSAPLQTSKLSVRALNGGSSGGGGGVADTSDVANLAFALSIFFS
jgi:hypothetical protein